MGVTQSTPKSNPFTEVTILCGKEGRIALYEAEELDGYVEECKSNHINSYARQDMRYSANTLSPQDNEALRQRILSFLPSIPPVLINDRINPRIVPLMPSADGGFPHTRPLDIICLPMSSVTVSLDTFVHELWHLHQRQYYPKWVRFFEEKWNYKIFEGSLPPHLEEQRRLNPDTLTNPLWIWNNEWVPICLFLNPSTPSFKDTATWYYNVRTRLHQKEIPKVMATFFSSSLPPSAYEHPSETSAYLLAGPSPCKAYDALIGWMGEGCKIQA
jgi:hypothetical protein